MKKDFIKFLMGVAVGTGMTIAAKNYMETEKGKKVAEDTKNMLNDFYKYASSKIKMIKDMSTSKYSQAIRGAAEEYGKMKQLSNEMVEELVRKTLVMWNDFNGIAEA